MRALRAALLVVVPLAAYASAPASGFVWDDHHVLERGQLVGSLANVPALFAHDTMYNSDGGVFAARASVDTYRPLTMSVFLVEHALWGARPLGYHVTSVLVHLACVLMLYRVGRRLALSEWAAAFGALAFAAHPSLGEAVHWVNGRSDPLCVLFFLVALDAWLAGRGLACALAMLAATLCKETAFVLAPAVVVLLARREVRARFWRARDGEAPRALSALARAMWPWAAGGAVGLALRLHALGHPAASAGGKHLGYALARLPLLWLDGLRSLAIPAAEMPPSLYERYRAPGAAWLALACVVLAAAAALAIARRRSLVAWGLASFACALAPVALLTYGEDWFGWGRYLYPAAPALALALGEAVVDGALPRLRPSLRRVVAAACGLALALCTAQSFAAGRDWRDDRAFAAALIADHPNSAHGYFELGTVEQRAGNAGRALDLALEAVALAPNHHKSWSLAAAALMQLGRRPEAFAAARRALTIDAHDAGAEYIAAIALLGEHREPEAAALLVDAIAGDPSQAGPWETLRQAAAHLGPSSPFVASVRRLLADPRYAAIAPRALASL